MKIVAVLVCSCALVAGIGASAERAEAGTGVQFGIQDDAWLEFGPGKLRTRIAKLDRLGLDAVRVTLKWSQHEPRSGRYRWRRSDRLLRAIRARGLRPIVTIWGTPGWANGRAGTNVAPRDPAHFERFVTRVAQRYRWVDDWVMWNEPNRPVWLRPASAKTYVSQILNPGYRAIKKVNPRAQVAGGVTGPRAGKGGISPVDFISRIRAAGAKLDVYAHHPYPVFPGDTPYKGGCVCKTITMASLNRFLRLVNRAFPRARVWITEYGYQTNPPDRFGVSLHDQARYVGEAARRVYGARKVDLLIHYLYRDEPAISRWQSGLETVTNRKKPALKATMLPLDQVSRRGARTSVWGQVRPGKGPQRFLIQRRVGKGGWVIVASGTTNGRGYFRRTISAPKGSEIRIWYSAGRVAGPPLLVL
jgi:hypothetical protein